MQLLYVWIEEYKNIKKQGFNFGGSPYHFEYDYDKKELIVTDNPSYIENFFNDKQNDLGSISNISAIIGANGSGKSSVLEWIAQYLVNENHILSKPNFVIYIQGGILFIICPIINNSEIIIDSKDIQNGIIKKQFYKVTIEMINNVQNTNLTFFSVPLFNLKNIIFFSNIFKKFIYSPHIISDISTMGLLNKINNSLDLYFQEEMQKIIRFYSKFKEKHLPFDLPDSIHIEIKYNFLKDIGFKGFPIDNYLEEGDKNLLKKYFDISKIESIIKKAYNIVANSDLTNDERCIHSFILMSFLHFLLTFAKKEQETDWVEDDAFKLNIEFNEFEDFQSIIIEIFHRFIEQITNIKGKLKADNSYIQNCIRYVEQLEASIEFINSLKEFIKSDLLNTRGFNLDLNNLLIFLKLYYKTLKEGDEYLMFKWQKNGKIIYLSSGEEAIINIYSRFYSIEKSISSDNHIIILIDEGDIYLHPDWQRRFVEYMLVFLRECFPNKIMQIIITSHSPFVISDLPKENVIFLDRDAEGNCIVSDMEKHKQTFGANIHTLLSDGFFMEGGLIGEFAKGKINEVINDLRYGVNLTAKRKKEIRLIIDVIGEPIIRNKLLQMYEDKFIRLSIDDEIESLKERIKTLENQKNDKN